MFTKRTTVVIFAIVTALALVTAGSYASSGVALGDHKKNTLTTSNSVSNNDLSLFACQSKAAKNSPVTQAEVDDCYNQTFPQGQGGQTQPQQPSVQQPSSVQGGQTQPQQPSVQQPSSVQGGQT